jgi:hypothetical protein
VDVLPSAWASEANGVDVRYRSSLNFYSLRFVGGNQLVLGKNLDNGTWNGAWTPLGATPFAYNGSTWYHVSITVKGTSIAASVNGVLQVSVTDASLSSGAVGFDANAPVSFDNVLVTSGTLAAAHIGAGSFAGNGGGAGVLGLFVATLLGLLIRRVVRRRHYAAALGAAQRPGGKGMGQASQGGPARRCRAV